MLPYYKAVTDMAPKDGVTMINILSVISIGQSIFLVGQVSKSKSVLNINSK